jgi:hypothetical protein
MNNMSIGINITDKTNYIVTKSPTRLEFDQIETMPRIDETQGFIGFAEINMALSIFGAWCATIDEGCVQMFDAVHREEIGYLKI